MTKQVGSNALTPLVKIQLNAKSIDINAIITASNRNNQEYLA